LGAIFAGLGMAPIISAGFAATIFLLIKVVVHMRKNPVPWAVFTSPFFFLIAGTICTLSIVYKGSPNLGLNTKPPGYIAGVTLGTGAGVAALAALFFVPYLYVKIIKRDYTLKWWEFIKGPLLLKREAPADAFEVKTNVPDYAVVQNDDESETKSSSESFTSNTGKATDNGDDIEHEKAAVHTETREKTYKEINEEGEAKLRAKLLENRGPIGWAMRTLRDNPMGPGQIYEIKNIKILIKRYGALLSCSQTNIS
jgi:solute carrier family 20 (sodium-dependent phosphate transporter)